MITNNITRLLQSRKIPFSAFELPVEKISAEEAAQIIGVPAELVYKTIVVTREKNGKPILAVIPGPNQVNLKTLAAHLGEKKVTIPTQKEAEKLTGLQAGGISPLALINHGFQVIIDIEAQTHQQIYISGGQRGLNIKLPVDDLAHLTKAQFATISSPPGE